MSLVLHDIRFQWIIAAILMMTVILRTVFLLNTAWGFNTDDAYITLRYSRNLVNGQGIVWNAGEIPATEGYSNFSFVILGAIALKMGWDPLKAFKLLCSSSLIITCWLLYMIARFMVSPIPATIPAILITTYLGTIWWTVSGLETSFYQAIVIAAFYVYLLGLGYRPVDGQVRTGYGYPEYSTKLLGISGSLIFLASITRPEGPIFWIAFSIPLLINFLYYGSSTGICFHFPAFLDQKLRDPRGIIAISSAFWVPYAMYFIWRLYWFERIFPNSVYCKSGYEENPFSLLESFFVLAWPFLLLAVVGSWRKLDILHAVIWLLALFFLVVYYKVDPILGYYNRYFLSICALVLIPTTSGILRTFLYWLDDRKIGELAIVLALIVLTGYKTGVAKNVLYNKAVFYANRMDAREQMARWINQNLHPQDSFVIGDAGLVPYLAVANVMDAYCLNSGEMTRPPINRSPERYVETILERKPEIIVVQSVQRDVLIPPMYFGTYPLLVAHPDFAREYSKVNVFGAQYDDIQYLIYKRKD